MKAGEQLSTFVVPTSLACVARGIRAGVLLSWEPPRRIFARGEAAREN